MSCSHRMPFVTQSPLEVRYLPHEIFQSLVDALELMVSHGASLRHYAVGRKREYLPIRLAITGNFALLNREYADCLDELFAQYRGEDHRHVVRKVEPLGPTTSRDYTVSLKKVRSIVYRYGSVSNCAEFATRTSGRKTRMAVRVKNQRQGSKFWRSNLSWTRRRISF
jgi:hypothetical protein